VIFAARSQSSIRVRRINSVIVKTIILLSIVFRPRDCGVHGEAVSDGRGGDITCDRNGEKERATRA
jgi:hypothetical protein